MDIVYWIGIDCFLDNCFIVFILVKGLGVVMFLFNGESIGSYVGIVFVINVGYFIYIDFFFL